MLLPVPTTRTGSSMEHSSHATPNAACSLPLPAPSPLPDPFIWVPNGIGGLLSVSQIVLRLVFPAKQLTSAEATPTHA